MGRIKLNKDSQEFKLFEDYWNLLQEHWQVEDTDEYWDQAIKDSQLFYKKYQTPFAKELAVAYMSELKRRGKDGI